MSRWRSDIAAARPRSDHGGFHPIPILGVDLFATTYDDRVVDIGSDRAWVEFSHQGRVVGRTEVAARGGIVDTAKLEELARAFRDEGVATPDPVPDTILPFASVVVPTICRHPELLASTIQSLVALDYPSFEVIVVDNTASPESALPALPGGDRVRILKETRRGVSSARNAGLRAAKGELVAFTDDDAVVDPGWLRGFAARFASDSTVSAIGGLVLPRELETEPQLWFEEFYGGFSRSFAPITMNAELMADDPLFPYAAGRFGAGCNMAFRRDAIERIGGFDERLGAGTPARGGEDLAIFVGFVVAGDTVGFEPGALVRHSHRRTEPEFFQQVLGYGIGLTAMYSSLVASDRRHLLELARRIPKGIKLLLRPRSGRSVSVDPSYPRRTILVQVLGMAMGPFAYLRSRWWAAKHP